MERLKKTLGQNRTSARHPVKRPKIGEKSKQCTKYQGRVTYACESVSLVPARPFIEQQQKHQHHVQFAAVAHSWNILGTLKGVSDNRWPMGKVM